MPAWMLLMTIPLSLAVLVTLLATSALVEQRVLSPRSLILSTVRARRNTPEYTEAFVASQVEELLGPRR